MINMSIEGNICILQYMGIYLCSLDVILANQPRSRFHIIVQVVKGINIVCQPNERYMMYLATLQFKLTSSIFRLKKIPVVPISQPTLFFSADPLLFFSTQLTVRPYFLQVVDNPG
jgi:hypothetical protein